MSEGKASRVKLVVNHSNFLSPEDWCRFIHLDGFTRDWKDIGLTDLDLSLLEVQIMVSPQSAPVVAGTGGVRKMRFRPQSWNKGKSGSIRVLYAVFPDYSVVVLAAAYAKSQQGDISAADKKALKQILGEMLELLRAG